MRHLYNTEETELFHEHGSPTRDRDSLAAMDSPLQASPQARAERTRVAWKREARETFLAPKPGLPASLLNACGLLRAALADGDQLFARAIKQGPGRKRRGSHASLTQLVGGRYRE